MGIVGEAMRAGVPIVLFPRTGAPGPDHPANDQTAFAQRIADRHGLEICPEGADLVGALSRALAKPARPTYRLCSDVPDLLRDWLARPHPPSPPERSGKWQRPLPWAVPRPNAPGPDLCLRTSRGGSCIDAIDSRSCIRPAPAGEDRTAIHHDPPAGGSSIAAGVQASRPGRGPNPQGGMRRSGVRSTEAGAKARDSWPGDRTGRIGGYP
jgi:hypothetical protein